MYQFPMYCTIKDRSTEHHHQQKQVYSRCTEHRSTAAGSVPPIDVYHDRPTMSIDRYTRCTDRTAWQNNCRTADVTPMYAHHHHHEQRSPSLPLSRQCTMQQMYHVPTDVQHVPTEQHHEHSTDVQQMYNSNRHLYVRPMYKR